MKQSILLMTALVALTIGAQAQAPRIGVIDLKVVFDGYWKTKEADARIKERDKEFKDKKQQMVDDYEKANQDYRSLKEAANDQAVSAVERERRNSDADKKLQEIKDLERDIRDYNRAMTESLLEMQKRMRDKIVREIRELIDQVARARSYSLVLDIAAEGSNGTPIVIFSDRSNDVTDEVLGKLNASAPPASRP